MATPIFLTGFENGVATINTQGSGLWNTVNGTPSVQNTTVNTGSYALQSNVTATTGYVEKTITTQSLFVGRIYFRYGTLPNSRTEILMHVGTLISGLRFAYLNTDNKIYAVFGTTGGTASSSTVTTNTWYRLDYRVSISGTTGTVDWQIDGVPQTQHVDTGLASGGTVGNVRIGFVTSTTANGYWDDFVLSTTSADYPIGAGGTQGLVPAGDGTHNAGTNVMEDNAGTDIGATAAYDKLNKVPMSTATTYVRQAATGTGNYAEVNFGDLTQTPRALVIGAMGVLAYTSATTTANRGATIMSKDSFSTQSDIWGNPTTTADMSDGSTSSLFYKSAIISGVNTEALANALQARIGYSGDANPNPYWVNLMAEVAYTTEDFGTATPTLGDISVSGSGTVSSSEATGTLSKTLDDTTSTTASSLLIDATLSKTLDDITSTTEVDAIATGTASLTFDNNTLTASAVATYEPITGSLTSTLGDVTTTTAGTVSVGGTLSKTLTGTTSSTAVGVLITGSTPAGGGSPGTQTKSWNFVSDVEGFTDVEALSNQTFGYIGVLGSPSVGCVRFVPTNNNTPYNAFQYARTGTGITWETWGVPSGATVTSVKVASYAMLNTYATALVFTGGIKMRILNSSNNIVHSAGLLVDNTSPNDYWTTYTSSPSRNVDSSYQASNTNVKFEMSGYGGIWDDGEGYLISETYIDSISLEISYTTSGGAGGVAVATVALSSSGSVAYTGTLSKTLADTTVSASGTVAIDGSLSKSLGDVTITGSGTVAVDGTLSKTLDNITSTTASTLSVSGTLSKTLDDITSTTEADAIVTGSGTSLQSSSISLNGVSNAEISGTLSKTLGDVTSSSSATLSITGTSSVEAVSTTISATGVVEAQPSITGDLSKTLDNITVSGSGTVDVSGSLSRTLGDTTLSGSATVDITGSLSKTLDAISLSASASLLIDATLSKTLDAITETGSATNLVTGSLSQESVSTTTSASGTVDITGTLSRTLSDTTSSSASTLSVSGTLSKTLGDVTLEGVGNLGAVPITGSLTSTLDSLSVSGSASVEVSGTLSKTLDNISTTADAVVLISGSLSQTLDSISSSSAGLVDVSGTLTTTLGNITSSGTGFIAGSLFLEQEGFRFRNDDGSEATATWLASQDSNILVTPDMPFRIRILIDSSGGASSSSDYQLEYRKKISTAPDVWNDWKKVE